MAHTPDRVGLLEIAVAPPAGPLRGVTSGKESGKERGPLRRARYQVSTYPVPPVPRPKAVHCTSRISIDPFSLLVQPSSALVADGVFWVYPSFATIIYRISSELKNPIIVEDPSVNNRVLTA